CSRSIRRPSVLVHRATGTRLPAVVCVDRGSRAELHPEVCVAKVLKYEVNRFRSFSYFGLDRAPKYFSSNARSSSMFSAQIATWSSFMVLPTADALVGGVASYMEIFSASNHAPVGLATIFAILGCSKHSRSA